MGLILFGLVALVGAILNDDIADVLIPITTGVIGILGGAFAKDQIVPPKPEP